MNHTVRIINDEGKIVFNGHSILSDHVVLHTENGEIRFDYGIGVKRYAKIKSINGVIEIGANSTINDFPILQSNTGGIKISWGVRISPFVKIFAENHAYHNANKPIYKQGLY